MEHCAKHYDKEDLPALAQCIRYIVVGTGINWNVTGQVIVTVLSRDGVHHRASAMTARRAMLAQQAEPGCVRAERVLLLVPSSRLRCGWCHARWYPARALVFIELLRAYEVEVGAVALGALAWFFGGCLFVGCPGGTVFVELPKGAK
jgi:hypothetical protein